MEASSWLVGIAYGAAFLSAASIAVWTTTLVRSYRAARKAEADVAGLEGASPALLRNGVAWCRPLAKALLRIGAVGRFFAGLETLLLAKGVFSTPVSLCSLYCALAMGIGLVVGIVGASLPLGIVAAAGSATAGAMAVMHAGEKRKDELREAVPDALRSMSVCSQSGLSLLQTFHQVASETEDPLKSLFLHAAHDLETGRTAAEALDTFRERSDLSELAFIAVALDVQHKAGGALRQILDAARDSVESELDLRRSLKVQTAQAKLSARIVSIMPFVLIALFSFLSPGFLSPFFSSTEGLALLALAAAMQAAGILCVRRLLNVGVD